MSTENKKLVIVTGLSGSGKSITLNALEDAGFYCIDNLPVSLLRAFIDELVQNPQSDNTKAAVGIDTRNQSSALKTLPALIRDLQKSTIDCEILFLDAQNDILVQRFSETRRRHPLTNDEHALLEAIRIERELLEPLRNDADLYIDTSHSNLHQLRHMVRGRMEDRENKQLFLSIESFGFKHGIPRDADFMFDMRCLPNPHWQPELRSLTGKDQAVSDFLESNELVAQMLDHIVSFLERWIPAFEAEGRSYLTVAIGCTGGQHRSVYMTERMVNHFKKQGRPVLGSHRELS